MATVPAQYQICGSGASDIADDIERGVTSGQLRPDAALPSVRDLAGQLGVSPATVASAYRRLQTRGVLTTAERRGTRVSHRPSVSSPLAVPIPAGIRDLASGNPDPRLLPDLTGPLRAIDPPKRLYGEPANLDALVALARERLAADGIDATRLAVTSGAMDGLERVLDAHVRPGDRIAVEDPCWTGVLDLLRTQGLHPEAVTIDDEGPLPERLDAVLATGVRAVILTPRAHNPSGAAISRQRASELNAVLDNHPQTFVVADDHAGEIAGTPLPQLLEGRAHWSYLRSVSKTLGPDLRVAILAGDQTTVARVEGRQRHDMRWVSHILQHTVAHLWADRDTLRLLDHARTVYASRRQALVDALRGHDVTATGVSGLNVWVSVPQEAVALRELWGAGWAVAAGEPYRLKTAPALRVTTATLEPTEAEALAEVLTASLTPSSRTSPA